MKNNKALKKFLTTAGYEFLEPIGTTALSHVYKVRNTARQRLEALKVIQLADLGNPKLREERILRFQTEVKVLNNLKEECPILPISRIYRFQQQKTFCYYTMQYIEGRTLDQIIRLDDVDIPWSVEIIRNLTWILEIIHAKGLLHRDIKPSNVLVDKHQRTWLLDFGIVKQLQKSGVEITQEGNVVGTLGYISPEQLQGQKLGPQSDIYSLGAILYELLTSQPLVKEGPLSEMVQQIVRSKPIPPSKRVKKVDKKLDLICRKMLHKSPKRRYQNTTTLLKAIDSYLNYLDSKSS